MGVRLESGVLPINNRRSGRKEEFNPFAKDASQQHRRRRDERERQHGRRPTPTPEPTAPQQRDIKAELERKQREAIEKLEQKGDVSAPVVAPAPAPIEPVKKSKDEPVVRSHEDRLAELRRKSEETKKSAQRIEAAPEITADASSTLESTTELANNLTTTADDAVPPNTNIVNKAGKNVFARIETKIAPKQDRRRRRRFDKKGGGRQKQERKLNRQKYLEYKYAAKDILDNPHVPEEHRSNVLGQIWAKGERQGMEECFDFIEAKEAELILPPEVSQALRELVKGMTTKR